MATKGTFRLKSGLAQMLKGGVIMDVVNASQAKIAEDAGAVAVMALEKVPADIRAAGGVATPADAALCMQLGVDGVFVGSGIYKSNDPEKRAKAIVEAVAHFTDAKKIAKVSENIGEAMKGLDIASLETKLAARGV